MTIDLQQYPVLFVDDDAAVVTVMRYTIGERFTLLTARSGDEALSILAEQDVAVLLTDQRMPEMTGVELCAFARVRRPDLVTMIITAYADISATIDAINRGQVGAYLPKPWTDGQLVEALQVSIERVRATRLVRELGVEMARSAPAHVMPAVHRRLARDLLQPISEGENHARKAIELLQGLGPPEDDDEARRLLAIEHQLAVLAALDRLTKLATLELVDIEPPQSESCDVASLVEGVVVMMRPEVERRATMHLVINAAPSVAMQRAALGSVVITLLTNAIEAVQDQPDGMISVEVTADTGAAFVRVRDTGGGTAEDREREGGSAVPVARDLVEGAGGAMVMRSEAEGGTTFEVRLPRLAPRDERPNTLMWGPFVVDLIRNRILVDGVALPRVASLQVRLFAYLIRNAGRVCTQKELRDALFLDKPEGEGNVKRVISELRSVCGSAGRFIVNVKAVGYGLGIDTPDN